MSALDDRPAVLVIAGSDSSGGAGLMRDLRTLTDFNVAALCAVTAVTAQSNTQLTATHHIPPHVVRQQIEAAVATRKIGAIKIGMLGTRATVEAVIASLPSRNTIPIVLDPVLLSSSGGVLLDDDGVTAMREQLLPRVTLVTPNIPEAATLLHEPAAVTEIDMSGQAERILHLGPQAVLVKGGHASGDVALDLLLTTTDPLLRLTAARVSTSMRGTGCALASAIAAALALGLPLAEACRRAKHYVVEQLLTQQ
jgi:hydroxymethylpyrimidine/phosphomethylpyrimidine kinase